jgi:hypothetical protein
MLVVFDADVLSLLLNPDLDPPRDPTSGDPVERATERLENLVADLEKARARIVIPTPALSEFLVIAGDAGPDLITELDKQAVFAIEPFDAKAAVERQHPREARCRGATRSRGSLDGGSVSRQTDRS